MFGESNLLWWLYLAAILVIICYHWLLRNRIEIITREVLLDSETGNFFWFDIFFDTFWAFSFFGFLWFTFFFLILSLYLYGFCIFAILLFFFLIFCRTNIESIGTTSCICESVVSFFVSFVSLCVNGSFSISLSSLYFYESLICFLTVEFCGVCNNLCQKLCY